MSTTLVSFNVSVPSAAFVQLLGSWDNFTKPYTLERDRKVGRDVWRICPSFTGIVCDGERIEAEPRAGGLLMGSTYWYYYLVDNDNEIHDPNQPTTRACPFLPGQEVNVLQVPVMVQRRRGSASSTVSSTVYTLDPCDKFALNPSREWQCPPPSCARVPPSSPRTPTIGNPHWLSRSSQAGDRDAGLRTGTAFSVEHLFRSKSRDSNSRHTLPFPSTFGHGHKFTDRLFWGRPRSQPLSSRRLSWLDWIPARNLWSAGDAQRLQLPKDTARISKDEPVVPNALTAQAGTKVEDGVCEDVQGQDRGSDMVGTVLVSTDQVHAAALEPRLTTPVTKSPLHSALDFDFGPNRDHNDFMSSFGQILSSLNQAEAAEMPALEGLNISEERVMDTHPRGLQKSYSTRSSTFFSTSNPASALFSRPMTPTQTEFSLDFSVHEQPVYGQESSSQQVYSLNSAEHASALTLRTLRALPDDSLSTPANIDSNGTKSPASRKRVEEWVDRSKSTLEELREDMGYLCSLIA